MANFNINKSILGGRLTADVELKQTQSGKQVCSFTLAVNRRLSANNETDFINCTAWGKTAEFISKYFKKGSSLCIVGSIQVRSWQDQNGNKRYATEVVADEALFVDGKTEQEADSALAKGSYIPDAYNAPQTANFEAVSADDDLPF
jgi:single-strand DNA-binding protein